MLGGSLGSRLLRGVGGSRGQFRARGVREGGAAMAAGESMAQRMVWVDLEMTGLDIEKDQIIEMACLITDSDLNILAEGPNLIIKQPDELLDSMSDWCKEHHGKSGLTKAVKESTITLQQAEYEFLSFVRQQTPPGLCPLAGNSVHADKKFLDKYMPQFMKHLHYRIIDVSTVKELCSVNVLLEGGNYSVYLRQLPLRVPFLLCVDAGTQKNMNLHQRRLLLTGPLMTLVKASKNCSFTEITSSRKKQMKRRGKL
ncbi:oligoribonuclease, mitochondrial isoform X1 [Nycticebus coucang]|uniref:oligoribonuclease, mitochondrial isoform X1 n=1 Tax=Nycticebus coucang TaxID=9470 RepID=UPI00234DC9C0|nr:oligoribonuclease, mitochondrial isoform X1 [Nycticebus coucang]